MKSTVLVGTLAAITFVSSLHAATDSKVIVFNASWRERTLQAPTGTIERNSGGSYAPRAYVVLDPDTLPKYKGAFIKYVNDRGDKNFTVTTGFTGYTADIVTDNTDSSKRIFGHIFTPVTVANVPTAMMPFSGSTHDSGRPRHIVFDKTVFQTGASTAAAAPVPNQFPAGQGTMARSILTGVGNNYENFAPVDLNDAVNQLITRLTDAGYTRNAVAPVITVDPPATNTPRAGFVSGLLTVTLASDVYPAPTYKWFKKAVAPATVDTQVGTSASYVVPAGDTGTGTYYVVVSTPAGSDTSTNSVVPAPAFKQFSLGATPLASVAIPQDQTRTLDPGVNADAWPVPTYQWQRANGVSGGSFSNVATGDGGTLPTFQVIGNLANTVRGAGARYQVIVSQTGGTPATATSAVSTVTIAP